MEGKNTKKVRVAILQVREAACPRLVVFNLMDVDSGHILEVVARGLVGLNMDRG